MLTHIIVTIIFLVACWNADHNLPKTFDGYEDGHCMERRLWIYLVLYILYWTV